MYLYPEPKWNKKNYLLLLSLYRLYIIIQYGRDNDDKQTLDYFVDDDNGDDDDALMLMKWFGWCYVGYDANGERDGLVWWCWYYIDVNG